LFPFKGGKPHFEKELHLFRPDPGIRGAASWRSRYKYPGSPTLKGQKGILVGDIIPKIENRPVFFSVLQYSFNSRPFRKGGDPELDPSVETKGFQAGLTGTVDYFRFQFMPPTLYFVPFPPVKGCGDRFYLNRVYGESVKK